VLAKAYFPADKLAFERQFTPIVIHPARRESRAIPDALCGVAASSGTGT
jgi:hypothetical protein